MPGSPPLFNYLAGAYMIYLPFAFALGAAAASFLTVVMDRVPRRQSIIRPPSHCDACGRALRWYENLPIIGYLMLRGRCSSCGASIPRHLFVNEIVFACGFALVFVTCFMLHPRAPLGEALQPAFMDRLQLPAGWPVYLLHMALLSALYAMTAIDLRTFTIPIEITWAVTLFAVLVHAVLPVWPAGGAQLPLAGQAAGSDVTYAQWVIPFVTPPIFCATIGGLVGVAFAWLLLQRGVLRYGFLDFDLYVGEDDPITDYPNPRGELEWELDYLGIVVAGLFLGWLGGLYWQNLTINTGFPLWCAALGGSLAGYFVGAGLIWGIRIFGTLLFGKEAMGMGDAHLLGCVGAALGWIDPILIFLLAPFLAIFGMLIGTILSSIFKGFQRVLPYGPWLSLATAVVMFGDWWIEPFLSRLFGFSINLP